jgi:RecA/RadA recombinase
MAGKKKVEGGESTAKAANNADLMKKLLGEIAKTNARYHAAPESVKRLSFGSLTADMAIGGGLPRGAITEIYGANNTGKTTLAIMALREALYEAHERDMYCFFINAEKRPIDGEWYTKLGLPYKRLVNRETGEIEYQLEMQDTNGNPRLQFFEVESAEGTANLMMDLVDSGLYIMGVLDSVGALSPKAELETDMAKNTQMGLQSRFMARWMRAFMDKVRMTGITLVFLNHQRSAISDDMFAPKTSSPGGNHFHHQSTVRLETFRLKDEWESDDLKEHIRMYIRFYVRKTSVSDQTGRMVTVQVERDSKTGHYAVDPALERFLIARQYEVLLNRKGQTWGGNGFVCFPADKYGYNGSKQYIKTDVGYELGDGHEGAVSALREDVDMMIAIEKAIRQSASRMEIDNENQSESGIPSPEQIF